MIKRLFLLCLLLASFQALAADWYISSVAYTAVPVWTALATLSVGNVRRQTAPAASAERAFRVSAITTGITGAAEPTWNLGNSATTTDAGVTWTECTGQSAQQQLGGVTNTWTCPAATIRNLEVLGKNIVAASDRLFFSSDHTETSATTYYFCEQATTQANAMSAYSVDRTTGNIPPLAADITAGANLSITAQLLRTGGG